MIEEVTAHAQSDSLEDARERYAQTVLIFRVTYVIKINKMHTFYSNVLIYSVFDMFGTSSCSSSSRILRAFFGISFMLKL